MDIQSRFRAMVAGLALVFYAATPAIAEDIEIYTTANLGAHAEFISMAEDGAIAIKPANLDYAEAAAATSAG